MKKSLKSTILTILCLLISIGVYAASQSTSGKTADDIITEVEQVLNETVATSGTTMFLTNAIVLDWIDAGVREIVAKTKCLQDTADFVLVTGTSEYAWSGASDYVEIMACSYFDGTNYKSLTKTDIKSIGRVSLTKNSPQFWYEWEGRIGVWPVPITAYNGKTMYAYYVAVPNAITAITDKIRTPAMLDDALVWYVVSHAKMRDNKSTEAAYYMNLFNALIGQYRQDILYTPKESVNEAAP